MQDQKPKVDTKKVLVPILYQNHFDLESQTAPPLDPASGSESKTHLIMQDDQTHFIEEHLKKQMQKKGTLKKRATIRASHVYRKGHLSHSSLDSSGGGEEEITGNVIGDDENHPNSIRDSSFSASDRE